ncbi:2-succinylbenzoate--CoA ligase, partial [Haemophilus influenzae]
HFLHVIFYLVVRIFLLNSRKK